MKFNWHIPVILFMLTSASCAKAGPEMKRTIESIIPKHIQGRIENNEYSFGSTVFKLNREKLDNWFVEELNGFDIYEKKYKKMREYLVENKNIKAEDQIYDPLSSYDFAVNACEGWLGFLLKRYQLPDIKYALSSYDETCYRIIKITSSQVYAFDVILFFNKNGDFLNEKETIDSLLTSDLAYIKGVENEPYTFDGSIFRMAKFVEPSMESLNKVKNFALLQFMARRYFARSGILHFEFGKKRALDTYILMITAKKMKAIIQTFFLPDIKAEEIQQDLVKILDALVIY